LGGADLIGVLDGFSLAGLVAGAAQTAGDVIQEVIVFTDAGNVELRAASDLGTSRELGDAGSST